MATIILSQAGNAITTSPTTTTPTSSEIPSLSPFDHASSDKPDTKTNELPKKKSSRRANTAERRATHNAVERQRRETLNGRFLDLAALLPTLSQIRRPSKSAIVTSSISFIHAARHHRLLAARELRMMTLEADALKREVNEWRARAGVRPVEERERSEGWNVVMSGEMEMLDVPLPSVATNGGSWGLEDDLLEDDEDVLPPSSAVATSAVDDAQRFAQVQMSLHHPHPAAPAPMIVSPTAFEHPAATFEHLHLLQQQQQQQPLLSQQDAAAAAAAWYSGSPDATAFLTPPSSAHGHSSPGASPLRPSSSSSASSHGLPEITIAPSVVGGAPPALFGASSPAEQHQLDLELEEVAAGSDSGSIGHGSSLGHGHGASSPSSSASSCASSVAPSTFGQAHALALQHQQAVAAYELAALTANATAYTHHPLAHPMLQSQWKEPLSVQVPVQVGGYMM